MYLSVDTCIYQCRQCQPYFYNPPRTTCSRYLWRWIGYTCCHLTGSRDTWLMNWHECTYVHMNVSQTLVNHKQVLVYIHLLDTVNETLFLAGQIFKRQAVELESFYQNIGYYPTIWYRNFHQIVIFTESFFSPNRNFHHLLLFKTIHEHRQLRYLSTKLKLEHIFHVWICTARYREI